MHKYLNLTTFRRQRGDTMVEVLIAIAVVSLILGGAYVTTNRSLSATRAAQERGVALKLAESQIEQVKGLVVTNPDLLFGATAPSPFCIAKDTGEPIAASEPRCAVDTAGDPVNSQPIFHLSIIRNTADGKPNDFILTETWENVDGKNTDKLQMTYRVYE